MLSLRRNANYGNFEPRVCKTTANSRKRLKDVNVGVIMYLLVLSRLKGSISLVAGLKTVQRLETGKNSFLVGLNQRTAFFKSTNEKFRDNMA